MEVSTDSRIPPTPTLATHSPAIDNRANQKLALAVDFIFDKFGGDMGGPLMKVARGMMGPFRSKLLAAEPNAIKLAVAVFQAACERIENDEVSLEDFNEWVHKE